MNIAKLLIGHISPETAFVVDDYPYGFRLRCKIRYWLSYTPGRGVRFWSQTTNPKRPGEIWNKSKASTYCRFGGAMFLDEQGHVQWNGVHEYMDLAGLEAWEKTYGAGVPEPCKPILAKWIEVKRAYEAAKARGEVALVTRTTDTEGNVTEERETLKPETLAPNTQSA